MKSLNLGVIAALLLGVSVFGMSKSFILLKQNTNLESSLENTQGELTQTQASLEDTQKSLAESSAAKTKLEGEVNTLKTQIAQNEKEIQTQLGQIAQLTGKVQETAQVNVALLEEHNALTDRTTHLELENAEMRRTLSSVSELKKALKALRTKIRGVVLKKETKVVKTKKIVVSPKPAISSVPKEAVVTNKEAVVTNEAGNNGFLVKSGQSTFKGSVEIQVTPVESNAF